MTAPIDSSADGNLIGPPSASVHAEVGAEETILFDESSDMVVTLNGTGSSIWALCDGTRTLDQIITELAELYETTADAIRSDVRSMVDQLADAGFFSD